MLKVINEVTVYEVNGAEPSNDRPTIRILSHWNRSEFVVIEIDGHSLTVARKDLQAAIQNACNSARH